MPGANVVQLIFFPAGLVAVALVSLGIIQVPFFASFAYLGIVVALGYQLCNDAVRAADLASEPVTWASPKRQLKCIAPT
jgi:hypothetical protein